jgi:hypothetical protein
MASITYDGQSFQLDGRRVWLVSGSIHPSLVPRELWADRIHAAKLAGLNCIELTVHWNRHEPIPGQFDFTGDNDIRHFVELIGQAGLYCILRPGPYVGGCWDAGGLPPWLLNKEGVVLRSPSGPFLEACSRYLTALAGQIKDLQITSPGAGGSIILVQNESGWTCGDDELGVKYIGELVRYMREAGISVPIINANNLWQGVEGEIDAWAGGEGLFTTMRQLAAVRPNRPRLVIELPTDHPSIWGETEEEAETPASIQRRVVGALAGCSQYNLYPFHGGTLFGFWGGRLSKAADAFVSSCERGMAPLAEAGGPGPSWQMLRRVNTFASNFGRVLAHLDPTYRPVTGDPDAMSAGSTGKGGSGARGGGGCCITHAMGSQGGIAFVFGDGPGVKGGCRRVELVLPDGSSLPVELGSQSVAWCLLDVHLGGRAHLDYCNLNAFALVGSVFVCYGPAGAPAYVSINGSPIETTVPRGKNPHVIEHETMTVVICNEQQIDATYVWEDTVLLGAAGCDGEGKPWLASGVKQVRRLAASGESSVVTDGLAAAPSKGSSRVAMGNWSAVTMTDFAEGTSARYATIAEPTDLAEMGTPYGYGWYRLTFKSPAAKRLKLTLPQSADRLHMILDGEPMGVVGVGPGTVDGDTSPVLSLTKSDHCLVILAENFGRFSEGVDLGEAKGLYGHLHEIVPVRAGRPTVEVAKPVELLSCRAPLWHVSRGDVTSPHRLTWSFMHRRKSPIIMTIAPIAHRGLVLLNDEPIEVIEPGLPRRLVLDTEMLRRGKNVVQITLAMDDDGSVVGSLASLVNFTEGVAGISSKGKWAFATWQEPNTTAYRPVAKTALGEAKLPTWWRTTFKATDTDAPLYVDLAGMTKGQLYVNGRHVGRYFVATSDGKPVGDRTRYLLPQPWLTPGEGNELVLFDEHGGNPGKAKLAYDNAAAPITVSQ